MLTLEEEEPGEVLRRDIVAILHVPRDRLVLLPAESRWREGFTGLQEVKSELQSVHLDMAALRLAVPPFLPATRLREVLRAGLKKVLGEILPLSLRVPTELGETLQAAIEMEEAWIEKDTEGSAVLCFTDEHGAGEVGSFLLSDLRTKLAERLVDWMVEAFPLNHYDAVCLWAGPVEEKLSSAEAFVSMVYRDLTGALVSATSRPLEEAPDLLEFLGS